MVEPDTVRRIRSRGTGIVIGAVALGGAAVALPAVPAHAGGGASEAVVQVVDRAPFGNMLANVRGRSLYKTAGACTGQCLVIWPPLVMAAGKTVPTGTTSLGTVPVVVSGISELQVTYKGKPLYKFEQDSGTEVTGNGLGGFKVAKVH